MLPPVQRAAHQLLIAGKINDGERQRLRDLARRHGLAPDEMVLTGYVSDADLIDLYRGAALFVFPSLHEGFGLPALEAMACGALVIGADSTSVPEVIGNPEALFDPRDPAAIAARIRQVLDDPALQARLREHGAVQARKFSWDHSARRAIAALEAHAAAPAPDTNDKPRIAFLSPLPPERTGVADYAVRLVLATHPEYELSPGMTRSYVRYGASPRGAQTLVAAAKIRALLESRMNVAYEDVQAMALPALRHRIMLNFDAEATGVSADSVIARVIEAVPTTGF